MLQIHPFNNVPPNWTLTTLGTMCERGEGRIQTGPFGSQLHASDYVAEGIPSIMPQNIKGNRIVVDGIPRITPADAKRLSRHRVQPGDIIYSRRGEVDQHVLITESESGWLCGTGCMLVRLSGSGVDPKFYFYFLSHATIREWIRQRAIGATMPNLNTGILSAVPLLVPPLPEQRAIAHILGTLDNKIELNRKMNETLEAIARALFKSWFVDFDPVHAKVEGRQPAGMDAEAAALFPDAFEDSELGEIPKGWHVKSIDEIADFLNGLALQNFPPDADEYLPVIKIAELRRGNTEGSDEASARIPSEYVVHDGDVVFSWSGSLEVRVWCGGTGALNQHLFKVTSKDFPKWFYYHWVLHHLPDFQSIAAGKATTMGHIQRHHLGEAKVLVPSFELLGLLDRIASPLLDSSISNAVQSRTLAAIRDALLPKLTSGEVRVPLNQTSKVSKTSEV